MEKKKLVLAYSGGLDTSVILHWLIAKGYEVITFTADLGQEDDFEAIRKKALAVGATKARIEDMKEEFVRDFIFPAISANAVYEGRYLLGTSLARPLTARKQIEIAKEEGAVAVAHGATGKGNDQVRFELAYHTLAPGIEIVAPWKDEEFLSQFQGRADAIEYAAKNGIPIKQTKDEPWSTDENIMHISYEAGELEDPARRPRESMFERTVALKDAPDKETLLEITFERGIPIEVKNLEDNTQKKGALELFQYLNKLAEENGIGREDIVENRFVGIKSRGVYETPAGTILMKAHRDLEGLTLDREVTHIRDGLIPKFAEIIYNGFWFSPEMEALRVFFEKTQEYVSGKVRVALYKGNVTIAGRDSPFSLYDQAQSSMDIAGGYNPKDAIGFIKVNAIRLINDALRRQRTKQ
ncbi:MAG: argininosuccinate synthase [Nanoarchaeota archaeon]|nr:argininosuccinate synthase [Nanoarchaeota archaeon]